jgi:hypothetical protein
MFLVALFYLFACLFRILVFGFLFVAVCKIQFYSSVMVFGKFRLQYGITGFNKLHHGIKFTLENETKQQ